MIKIVYGNIDDDQDLEKKYNEVLIWLDFVRGVINLSMYWQSKWLKKMTTP